MKNTKQKLIIEQVDRKLRVLKPLEMIIVPKNGWVNTVRVALKMSLKQLGKRMKITMQSVSEIEKREASGTITLNTLNEAAKALNMRLVYGFIPKENSLEE